jgi:hypothetical protein
MENFLTFILLFFGIPFIGVAVTIGVLWLVVQIAVLYNRFTEKYPHTNDILVGGFLALAWLAVCIKVAFFR